MGGLPWWVRSAQPAWAARPLVADHLNAPPALGRARLWHNPGRLRGAACGEWRGGPTHALRVRGLPRSAPLLCVLVVYHVVLDVLPSPHPPRVHATHSLFRATWSMQELRWIPKLLSKYIPRSRRKDFTRDLAIAQGAVIFFGLMLYAYVWLLWPVGVVFRFCLFGPAPLGVCLGEWCGWSSRVVHGAPTAGPPTLTAFSTATLMGRLLLRAPLLVVAFSLHRAPTLSSPSLRLRTSPPAG